MPYLAGHRQITDAHLLVLARRQGTPPLTFDAGIASLAERPSDVQLLKAI